MKLQLRKEHDVFKAGQRQSLGPAWIFSSKGAELGRLCMWGVSPCHQVAQFAVNFPHSLSGSSLCSFMDQVQKCLGT